MEEMERYEESDIKTMNFTNIYDNEKGTLNFLSTKAVCDLLNQQDKRIKELENMNSILSQGIYWGNGEHFCDVVSKLKNENQQLKQQLHDLPNKIVGEIKEKVCEHSFVTDDYNLGEINIKTLTFTRILDTILKNNM